MGLPDADIAHRDDALLPITRGMGYAIMPVLLAAAVILIAFPTRTEALWAWTVTPPVTATTMGGGYLAGAYFFFRVIRADRWHTIGRGLPAITAFTTLLLLATVLHWDKFTHDHVSFWAWILLYAITPPLLPLVWLRNRRRDPGTTAPHAGELGWPLRMTVAAAGAVLLVLALTAFAAPALAVERWPWPLTPLTARTIAAFASFPAMTLLTFAWEPRWSALARLVEATALGIGFTTAGVALHLDDLTATGGARAAYLLVLAGSVGLLAMLLVSQRSTSTGRR